MNNDIAASMNNILNSDKMKSLFGKTASDHSDKNDDLSTEVLNSGMGFEETKEGAYSEIMAKYPNALQALELLKAEQRFPHLMERLLSGDFSDENNADKVNLAGDEAREVKVMLDGLDNLEISTEFANLLDDMGINCDDTLPIEEDLTVEEDMGETDLGDPMLDFASADLAIDSLLVASAALDKLSLSRSSALSLEMASMIIEAKKKSKSKKDDDDDDDDDDDKKSKKSKSKKDDDDDDDDKKSKKSKSKKDDDDDDKKSKKSKKS